MLSLGDGAPPEIACVKPSGARRAACAMQFLLEAWCSRSSAVPSAFCRAGVSATVRRSSPRIPATLSYLWVTIGLAISMVGGPDFRIDEAGTRLPSGR